jgi:hypothetical protein
MLQCSECESVLAYSFAPIPHMTEPVLCCDCIDNVFMVANYIGCQQFPDCTQNLVDDSELEVNNYETRRGWYWRIKNYFESRCQTSY